MNRHEEERVAAASMLRLERAEAHVWFAWTERAKTPQRLAQFESWLNEQERHRLARFAFDHLKLEYLMTRALCRSALSHYASVHPRDWAFETNAYGRPEITPRTGLRFNLSNARSLVACVVTQDVDAGIDVEELDRLNATDAIAERFFSPAEVRRLRDTPEQDRRRQFFEFWTLKESYIKARGMGLAIPLEQFSFLLDGSRIGIEFSPQLDDTPTDWQFQLHSPGDRHLIAIAIRRAQSADFRITLREGLTSPYLPWTDS